MEPSATPSSLLIATRESRLALAQSEQIAETLRQRFHFQVGLLGMTTQGDRVLDRALSQVGGKGIFVKELEAALMQGQAHLAVHSLKDVPMALPEGFVLAAIPRREDPRDAFVSHKYASLDELPAGATVGTSSLRRQVLLHAMRPDLQIVMLRGNLDTRLRKLDDGAYDAIVLAVAGLKRLQLEERIRSVFDVQQMIPSAGQGALGIEMHQSQPELIKIIEQLNDPHALVTCTAERAVSRALGGNCSVPLAAHATWHQPAQIRLDAAWGDIHGKIPLIRSTQLLQLAPQTPPAIVLQQAEALGQQAASDLVAQGAQIAPATSA
ncbi:hydroxymethylbilane synthase [Saezia sanguinis]|uniref:hydroxymethylbilane synthase n=1 Tax=Saezia sanguinis TaxID=1965230 RepID=UPI0030299914